MKRTLAAIVSALALTLALGVTSEVPASASQQTTAQQVASIVQTNSQAGPGHCAGVNRTLAYPVNQLQNLSVNQPWGPIYVFQNAPILLYHDANGTENFYGFYIGWVSYERVYHDYFTWPAQPGQSQITTVPPIHFGDFILIEIPVSNTYPLGNCVITNP